MGPVLVVHRGIANDDRPGDVSFVVLKFSTFFFPSAGDHLPGGYGLQQKCFLTSFSVRFCFFIPAQVIIFLVAMGSNISVF